MSMTFTDAELHTIRHALEIAAGTFDKDATDIQAVIGVEAPEAAQRLIAAFDRQSRDARKIVRDIDAHWDRA